MGIENRNYYRDDIDRPMSSIETHSIVTLLIVANVIVLFLVSFVPVLYNYLELKPDWFTRPWEIYTLLTYGFVHAPLAAPGGPGIMHILFNMLSLFFLGPTVEQHYGRREFLWFYLLAIIFSGMVWVIAATLRSSGDACVGASGAVVAVVMLFILNFPRVKLMVWGVLPVPAWLIGALLVGSNFLGSLGPKSGTAFEAHLGGAAFAALYFYSGTRFTNWISEGAFAWKKKRSGLKVHNPQNTKWNSLQKDGDRILEKISEQGEESLTRSERKTLAKYSEELRRRKDY